jgi:DNA-binding transcriptional regulator YdaS (Cro superfamily)
MEDTMVRNSSLDPDDPRAMALRKALRLAGGNRIVAERYKISSAAVSQWAACPPERVLDLERLSGISRYELRPDIFGPHATDVSGGRIWDVNVDKALVEYGKLKLAEALDLTETEIEGWEAVPPTLVLKVEKLTGLSRYQLRPDVFGEAPEPAASAQYDQGSAPTKHGVAA